MKTFIADIIPRLQEFSQKLDNLTLLTNQHWVVVDEIANSKMVYIFRPNNELLISRNGRVDRGKWEYLGNSTLLIDLTDGAYLFRHGFFDENILALKIDGKEEYAFLVNETKFDKELNSSERILEFLQRKYIEPCQRQQVESTIGIEVEAPKVIAETVKEKTPEELGEEQKKLEQEENLDDIIKITVIIGVLIVLLSALYAIIKMTTS